MADLAPQTRAAVKDLLAVLAGLDAKFVQGDRALPDEISQLEAYKWIFSITQVALDAFVWADPARPRFVDIVGPYKKWGGDNADAFYQYAPIDPTRTYRVSGRIGDAVYFSLTVYGGPDDGRYSERIVGSLNGREVELAPDGTFEFFLGPDDQPGPYIKLEPDAVCAITRDYLEEPATGRRLEWKIEALGDPGPYEPTDGDQARRFRAAITWVEQQADLVPLVIGEPNVVQEPYPVPKETFGWAAGDASYAMGAFQLADDEALVIRGTSPECVFWNLCLWNPFLHTFNYEYDRVTINGTQVAYEPDGSWTIVVSAQDPGRPNWITTQGHDRGLLWFRWFLPDETPARPTTEVVEIR